MKQIIIEIDNDGNCSLEGQGFVGPECEKSIGEIEKALGATTTSKKKQEHGQRAVSRSNRERTTR